MCAAKPISAQVQSAVTDLVSELHAKSGSQKIGLNQESFASILCDVATKHLPTGTTHAEARTFLLTLRVDELALARACAAGHNSAWEVFLTRYRESFISRRCASRVKTPPPGTWPTAFMPNSTAPPRATANAFPSWPHLRAGDRSKAGFAQCSRRNS